MIIGILTIIFTLVIVFLVLSFSDSKISSTYSFIPFLFSYLLFSFIGIPLLYLPNNSYVQEKGINDLYLLNSLIFISSVSIILVSISYVFFQNYFFKGTKNIIKPIRIDVTNRFLVSVFLILSFLSVYIYLSQLDSYALMLSFYDEDKSIALSRSNATNNFPHVWRYVFFAGELLPFLSYLLLAENILIKKKNWSFLFITSFFLFSFYSLINLQKSTLPFYLFSLVFCYKLSSNTIFVFKELLIFSILGFSLVAGILFLATGSEFNIIIENIFSRILSGTPAASFFYLKIFPYEHDFLLGQSLPNPGNLFPFEVFELTKYVSSYFSNSASGVVGSAPGPFWSDLYANFGYVGVFIICPLIGMIFNFIDYIRVAFQKSPLNIALFTYLTFEFRELSTTGFLPLFGAVNIFLVICIYMVLKIKFR